MLDFLLKRKRRKWADELVGLERKLSGQDETERENGSHAARDAEAVLDALVKGRHGEIAAESIEIIRKTVNPRTFFGRCGDIAFAEEQMTGRPSRFAADAELQTKIQIEFIGRAVLAGRKEALREGMKPYISRLTDEALAYYRSAVERQESGE